jgi:hypothetical protein
LNHQLILKLKNKSLAILSLLSLGNYLKSCD